MGVGFVRRIVRLLYAVASRTKRKVKRYEYPRQNGLLVALREPGRIERTLFILELLQNVELPRRVHAELNKGEARNALAREVFIHRLGEICGTTSIWSRRLKRCATPAG